MKFSKGDVVRRVLPSGIMIGSFMVVVESIGGVCTTVRDVSTGEYYIYKSKHLKKKEKQQRL